MEKKKDKKGNRKGEQNSEIRGKRKDNKKQAKIGKGKDGGEGKRGVGRGES